MLAAITLSHWIDIAPPRLRAITEEAAAQPRADGKWSRKQILGHLIDSAANNHQRFVRAQEVGAYRGPSYQQNHWVDVQGYQAESWTELIELWTAYNRHLTHVLWRMPETVLSTPCSIGDQPPVTLEQLAMDYLWHLDLHLRQLFEPENEKA